MLGVGPQVSPLGPLFFLIYINNFPDDVSFNIELFTGNTSLSSVTHHIHTPAKAFLTKT